MHAAIRLKMPTAHVIAMIARHDCNINIYELLHRPSIHTFVEALKMHDLKMTDKENYGSGKCRTGKRRTNFQQTVRTITGMSSQSPTTVGVSHIRRNRSITYVGNYH